VRSCVPVPAVPGTMIRRVVDIVLSGRGKSRTRYLFLGPPAQGRSSLMRSLRERSHNRSRCGKNDWNLFRVGRRPVVAGLAVVTDREARNACHSVRYTHKVSHTAEFANHLADMTMEIVQLNVEVPAG
jgi:hypothetical protein